MPPVSPEPEPPPPPAHSPFDMMAAMSQMATPAMAGTVAMSAFAGAAPIALPVISGTVLAVASGAALVTAVALTVVDIALANGSTSALPNYPVPQTASGAIGASYPLGGAGTIGSNVVMAQSAGNSKLQPGPYAGDGVPLENVGKKTASEQAAVNEEGDRLGCHTCGTKDPGTTSGNWVLDHQPPTKLGPTAQVGYPQCLACSRSQGGEVLQELLKRGR